MSMPSDLVVGIDQVNRYRSRYIAEALQHVFKQRQRQKF